MSHSPEPWEAKPYSGPAPEFMMYTATCADGSFVICTSGKDFQQSKANVERVCAAINACRKISTDKLEKIIFREHDDEKWHINAEGNKEYVPIEITGWPCGIAPVDFNAVLPLLIDKEPPDEETHQA